MKTLAEYAASLVKETNYKKYDARAKIVRAWYSGYLARMDQKNANSCMRFVVADETKFALSDWFSFVYPPNTLVRDAQGRYCLTTLQEQCEKVQVVYADGRTEWIPFDETKKCDIPQPVLRLARHMVDMEG